MPSYTVKVVTGKNLLDGTDNYVYITLVGTKQCSKRILLDKPLYDDFARKAVSIPYIQNIFVFPFLKTHPNCCYTLLLGKIIGNIK